jgi:hypothetical protein
MTRRECRDSAGFSCHLVGDYVCGAWSKWGGLQLTFGRNEDRMKFYAVRRGEDWSCESLQAAAHAGVRQVRSDDMTLVSLSRWDTTALDRDSSLVVGWVEPRTGQCGWMACQYLPPGTLARDPGDPAVLDWLRTMDSNGVTGSVPCGQAREATWHTAGPARIRILIANPNRGCLGADYHFSFWL